MRLALAALAATLLAACSPEYNWREVRSSNDGYLVLLPGKPVSMTREIRLDELEVSMTMQGARVGEASYTVAVATLPDDQSTTREKARAAMRAGMVRNIGGTESAAEERSVTVIDATGAARGQVPAVRVEASGNVQGKPATMLAGFTASGTRAYQWVVIGSGFPREEARTFLESFRLLQPGS
jgi:hypothetical protein